MLGKLRRRSLGSADVDVDGSRKVARADVRMQVTVVRHENAFRPVYTDGYSTYVYVDRRKFARPYSRFQVQYTRLVHLGNGTFRESKQRLTLRISLLAVNRNRFSTRYKMSGAVATFTIGHQSSDSVGQTTRMNA